MKNKHAVLSTRKSEDKEKSEGFATPKSLGKNAKTLGQHSFALGEIQPIFKVI
jgi:hypothetical protein